MVIFLDAARRVLGNEMVTSLIDYGLSESVVNRITHHFGERVQDLQDLGVGELSKYIGKNTQLQSIIVGDC